MVDRHLIGDLSLAILLALPAAAIAQPGPAPQEPTAATAPLEESVLSEKAAEPDRYSVLARG